MPSIPVTKVKIVAEDVELGQGTVSQVRRSGQAAVTGNRIGSHNIPHTANQTISQALVSLFASISTLNANAQAQGVNFHVASTALPASSENDDIMLVVADFNDNEVSYSEGGIYKKVSGTWTEQTTSATRLKISISDNEITTAKIANDAVTADKLADDSVTKDQLADNAVETAAIKDGAITPAKGKTQILSAHTLALFTAAKASMNVNDYVIVTGNFSETVNEVTTNYKRGQFYRKQPDNSFQIVYYPPDSELNDNSVTSDKIVDGSITDNKINPHSKVYESSKAAVTVIDLPATATETLTFYQNVYYRISNNANKATGNATYSVNDIIKYTPALTITARLNQTFSAFEKMPFTLTSAGDYIILDKQNVNLGKIVGQDNLKGRIVDDSNNIRITDTYFGSGAGSGVASMVATPTSGRYNFLCIDPESGKICYYAHSAYTKASSVDGAGGATRTFPDSAPQEVVRVDKWYQRASSAPSKPAEQTPASGSFFVHGSTYSVTGWTVNTPPAGSNTLYSVLAIMTYDKIFFSEVVTEPAGQDDIIHIDKLYRRAASKPEKPADLTGTYDSNSIAAADNWYRHKPATPANQTIWSTLAVITAHSIKFNPVIEEVADPHGTDPVLIFRKTSGSLSNDSANPENIDTGYNIDQFRWIEFVRYSSGAIGGNNTEVSTTKHRVKNANLTYNRRFTCNDSQTIMEVVTGLNSDGTAITNTFRAMGVYMLHFINNSSFYEIVDSNGADTPFEIYGYY